MDSPTKRKLTPADVAHYAQMAFGSAKVAACQELDGGGFAAVWRVRLDDGRDTVLKVAPSPDVRLLRYERELMAAETSYFRLVPEQVPVPKVLADSAEWLFTTFMPGTSLAELGDAPQVRHDLGNAMAQVHTVTGKQFGYTTGERPHGPIWREVFTEMIEDILADAVTWNVALDHHKVRKALAANESALDEVEKPALVHFDLWDGNVLAEAGKLSGLVDGERFLFGDPLIDFVSPAVLRRIEQEPKHPFLLGYAAATGQPISFDYAARTRLSLYRLHLYLLMTVELPSRGLSPEKHAYRHQALTSEVEALLANT